MLRVLCSSSACEISFGILTTLIQTVLCCINMGVVVGVTCHYIYINYGTNLPISGRPLVLQIRAYFSPKGSLVMELLSPIVTHLG